MTTTQMRDIDLKQSLIGRQHELLADVRHRIRDGREANAKDVTDSAEDSDSVHHDGIGLSLLQIMADTLTRIDEALSQLEEGRYGNCLECGRMIAERRLMVMPWAVRCVTCEGRREHPRRRVELPVERIGSSLEGR